VSNQPAVSQPTQPAGLHAAQPVGLQIRRYTNAQRRLHCCAQFKRSKMHEVEFTVMSRQRKNY